jgi:hypothetical protein
MQTVCVADIAISALRRAFSIPMPVTTKSTVARPTWH